MPLPIPYLFRRADGNPLHKSTVTKPCSFTVSFVLPRTRKQVAAQPGEQSARPQATAGEEEVGSERLVLGLVEPGDSLPLPYGWRHGGTLLQHFAPGATLHAPLQR